MEKTPPTSRSRKYIWIALIAFILLVMFIVIFGAVAGSLMGGVSLHGSVALLEVRGTIYDATPLIEELHAYRDNSSVRAIVVRVETPGGSASASQELFEEIRKIQKKGKKPVVASMGAVAASGGYYIACGAGEIFANPATMTGSIGVIMNFANWETLIKKIGIEFQVVKSGKFKDIGSPHRSLEEDERALLEKVINDVYDQFYTAVLDARKPALEKSFEKLSGEDTEFAHLENVEQYLKLLADGRIFTGRQARNYGFVDKLGNLDDAVERAADLGNIPGEPKVFQKKKRTGILDILRGEVKQALGVISPEIPMFEYRLVP